MKNNYINAMNKISASDDWREKTIAAMNIAKDKPVNKTVPFNKKWAIIAACAVFAICIPTAIDMLGLNSGFSTKNASLDALPQSPPHSEMAKGAADPKEEAGLRAMPFTAVPDILTQADATILVNDGLAVIKGSSEVGGYESEGLVIDTVTFDEETITFTFNVTDINGKKLILLVK